MINQTDKPMMKIMQVQSQRKELMPTITVSYSRRKCLSLTSHCLDLVNYPLKIQTQGFVGEWGNLNEVTVGFMHLFGSCASMKKPTSGFLPPGRNVHLGLREVSPWTFFSLCSPVFLKGSDRMNISLVMPCQYIKQQQHLTKAFLCYTQLGIDRK